MEIWWEQSGLTQHVILYAFLFLLVHKGWNSVTPLKSYLRCHLGKRQPHEPSSSFTQPILQVRVSFLKPLLLSLGQQQIM